MSDSNTPQGISQSVPQSVPQSVSGTPDQYPETLTLTVKLQGSDETLTTTLVYGEQGVGIDTKGDLESMLATLHLTAETVNMVLADLERAKFSVRPLKAE